MLYACQNAGAVKRDDAAPGALDAQQQRLAAAFANRLDKQEKSMWRFRRLES
jgi:hypothetical protein